MTVRVRWWLLNHTGTGDHLRHFTGSTGGPTPPPVETFHLLTEAGDALLTESGDFLTLE